MGVRAGTLPKDALLQRYASRPDCYTDCYFADVGRVHDLTSFVTAFYTAPLFRVERIILRFTVKRPSTDEDVRRLLAGEITRFAAWDIEAREEQQLLMCDLSGRTRSWFKVQALEGGTRLYFGSAVVPPAKDQPLGPLFRGLLGFHRLYSRALLAGALRRLR